MADFDGHGIPDVLGVDRGAFFTTPPVPGAVAVFLGLGDGSLSSPRLFPVAGNPPSAAVADLDGDGDVDAVTANGVVLVNTPY